MKKVRRWNGNEKSRFIIIRGKRQATVISKGSSHLKTSLSTFRHSFSDLEINIHQTIPFASATGFFFPRLVILIFFLFFTFSFFFFLYERLMVANWALERRKFSGDSFSIKGIIIFSFVFRSLDLFPTKDQRILFLWERKWKKNNLFIAT